MLTEDIKVLEREHAAFDIPLEPWAAPKPHGISGMFRLKNEAQFMRAAVLSHIKWLDEVILILQPSEDDTEKEAERLKAEYPKKVRIFHYPFPLHHVKTDEHAATPGNSVHSMVHFTNWGLSKCNFSWIAKTEGDVIALSTFARIREAIDRDPDRRRYYGRVGLNIAGPEFNKISFDFPRNAGWDEAVFNNHPIFHCIHTPTHESLNLHEDRTLLKNMGWSFLHVKRCKEGRRQGTEHWIDFTKDDVARALREYNSQHPYPGPDDSLGEDVLFEREWLNV